MRKPELQVYFEDQVLKQLQDKRPGVNIHALPRLKKIELNTGIDAEADKNQIADVQRDLTLIAGQKAVLTKSKKAIANFKLKEGQVVGARVTLRGRRMWEFLHRLLAVALPTIRDFRGVPTKLDGRGNYNLGISDFSIFPEVVLENVKRHMGLDIAFVTTALNDEDGRDLLRLLGMPFRRVEAAAKAS